MTFESRSNGDTSSYESSTTWMSHMLESFISRFDEDGDTVLNLDELKTAKTIATTGDDKLTADFTERHFGTLSLLRQNLSDEGVSMSDARALREDSTEKTLRQSPIEEHTLHALYRDIRRIDNR